MKLNLLKKLLCLSPVVVSPILVTACGSEKSPNSPDEFYLDFYQKELNSFWKSKQQDVNKAALDPSHQYDLKKELLDVTLKKVILDGASEFKKEFPKLDNYDANKFNDIKVSFSIPQADAGNLKLNKDVLAIYPSSIVSSDKTTKQINYTLSQGGSKELSGSLMFDLKRGFINYNKGPQQLAGNDIWGVFGTADLSTILVADYGGGLDVGTKQAGGGYAFVNYNTSGSGKEKLANDDVTSVYGTANLSKILVGELGGGLDVGIRQPDGTYKFDNYGPSTARKISDNEVEAVYGDTYMSEILVGENGGGIDVGSVITGKDTYNFKNYSSKSSGKEKLANNDVYGVYGNGNLSTILVGEQGGGLDVGTRAKASDPYNFKNYNASSPGKEKLANNDVYGVYGDPELDTILIGEYGGGLDIGNRTRSSDPYTFTNYNKSNGLKDNNVSSVYAASDFSKILVGEYGGGLDIGTRQTDGGYKFDNYQLNQDYVWATFGNSNGDLSSILVGQEKGGLDISSNLWFA